MANLLQKARSPAAFFYLAAPSVAAPGSLIVPPDHAGNKYTHNTCTKAIAQLETNKAHRMLLQTQQSLDRRAGTLVDEQQLC